MKIGLVRHFPVNHLFLKGVVAQSQVLQWFREYNEAAVHQMQVAVGGPWDVCYSSQLERAKRTAGAVYKGEFICSELLNEPFPDPVFKRDIKLPFLLWAMLIRVALLGNHPSQSQRKGILERRLRSFLPELFSHGDANVLIVSHAFTMEILSRLLLREGFTGRKLSRPKSGKLYVYEKADVCLLRQASGVSFTPSPEPNNNETMLYSFTKLDQLQSLPEIQGLEVKESDDPLLMSVIGQIPLEEATSRLANGNRAYVAYLDGVPASFGWMATGKARIGELNHEFTLPLRHGYLWNFRTLAEFRGRGIYPHLLQFILREGRRRTDRFWVMHAPENVASQRGILKAGFSFIGKVSVVDGGEVIFYSGSDSMNLPEALGTLGFAESDAEQATCWNCSSPYLKKRKPSCCCAESDQECTRNLFTA